MNGGASGGVNRCPLTCSIQPSVASLRRRVRTADGPAVGPSAGSAVALTEDGFLVTSAHVVRGADVSVAVFPDGRELGVQVVVDSKSALYLKGTHLDYSSAMVAGGFKFSNPNAKASCSCGESFSV